MNTQNPLFSIIIPVYNRPQEVQELLESLTVQTSKNFEVIIVEDGSSEKCEDIAAKYTATPLYYYYKENGGPAVARNFGAEKANGEWIVFFDSDCIIPEQYFAEATLGIASDNCELFGGADRSHNSFTPLQKAIDYSMTSLLTTGGIRGNKKSADKFYPRTFNMGIKKEVFFKIGGFSNMRFGEDVDFSYKVKEGGYKSSLFTAAWVYHKRRNTFRTFFNSVSGEVKTIYIKNEGYALYEESVTGITVYELFGNENLLLNAVFQYTGKEKIIYRQMADNTPVPYGMYYKLKDVPEIRNGFFGIPYGT